MVFLAYDSFLFLAKAQSAPTQVDTTVVKLNMTRCIIYTVWPYLLQLAVVFANFAPIFLYSNPAMFFRYTRHLSTSCQDVRVIEFLSILILAGAQSALAWIWVSAGDIAPVSAAEELVAVVIILVGLVVFGFIISGSQWVLQSVLLCIWFWYCQDADVDVQPVPPRACHTNMI